ncbi:aminotransferase [Demequina sp.]|uniref:aminotransferase n=1 Tax=Demequina sp. TaxID=2050685 RepID=UPI0025F723F2|nr:aminotransferase [Demequina sp.]
MNASTSPGPAGLTSSDAAQFAAERFDVDVAEHRDLGSNEDQNLLLTAGDGRRLLLKVSHPGIPLEALEAQNAVLAHLRTAPGDGPVPTVPAAHVSVAGREVEEVELDSGARVRMRLLDFLPGSPPVGARRLAAGLPSQLGAAAGAMSSALRDFAHPGLPADGYWDLRGARLVLDQAAPRLGAPERDRLEAVLGAAEVRLAPVRDGLRVQAIHGDLTVDNVVVDGDGRIAGVIDFGDVGHGWTVAEIAVCACALLQYDGDALHDALDAIAAFDRVAPLTEAEVVAVWPLVVQRAVVLAAAGEQVLAADPDNDYARARRPLEARMLERATLWALDEAELLVRHALGRIPGPGSVELTPMIAGLAGAPEVDLSVTAPAYDGGAWRDPSTLRRALAAARQGHGGAVTRFGEALLLPEAAGAAPPRSVLTGRALAVDPGTVVTAPADGVILSTPDGGVSLSIDGGGAVHLRGVDATVPVGTRVARGALVARASDAGDGVAAVLVWQCMLPHLAPPALVAPGHEDAWLTLCPDPAALVGRDPTAASSRGTGPSPRTAADLLAARDRAFARVQEHYYAAPPQIERGWRHHLIDTAGRGYLDMINNVAILGHGEPRLADAVGAQLRRLNTNSRFHYHAVVELSEALAARAPDGLDAVLLVNSGSEAVDLAIRIARAATGRTDVLALTEAYHGWTVGADAISTSLGDNPGALATRPDWVHLLDAPNTYRGIHRGAEGHRYLEDALGRIEALDTAGVALAGFVSEPIFGNGGGILLPDGYLAGVWEAVRARGGICVSDEVQVSYGRLGEHFWGFEQQGVVPDVIAVAKAMGNGHPLGAVITTRAIAEAFAAEGSFFSSAGGSPVGCVVGATVLRVLEQDRLQDNARDVGASLADGLRALAARHPALGAVHGMGLYLGVEVVDGGPDHPDPSAATEICEALLDEGVIVQPTGDHKNVLKIKPPLTIDAAAVDRFLTALGRVMVLREARAAL